MARRKLPIGTAVTVHPEGHLPDGYWVGEVTEHVLWKDGTWTGLTLVRCTNPRGFMNNSVGHVTQFDARYLRVVPEQPGDEQLALGV